MPRFIFGESYGDVANRQMGYDAARDQRFFQSLQAQRAAQNQLNDEAYRQAAFRQSQQEAMANRMFRNRQLELSAAQAAREMEGNELFRERKLDIDEGRLGVAEERLGIPTAAETRAEERALAQQEEDALTSQFADRYADVLNRRSELSTALSNLGRYKSRTDKYDTDRFGFGRYRSEAERMASEELGLTPIFQRYLKPGDTELKLDERVGAVRSELDRELNDLERQASVLEREGVGSYVAQDPKTGKYRAIFRRGPVAPEAFNPAPSATTTATGSGGGAPAPAPVRFGPMPQSQPMGAQLATGRIAPGMPLPSEMGANAPMALPTPAPTGQDLRPLAGRIVIQGGRRFRVLPDGTAEYLGPANGNPNL